MEKTNKPQMSYFLVNNSFSLSSFWSLFLLLPASRNILTTCVPTDKKVYILGQLESPTTKEGACRIIIIKNPKNSSTGFRNRETAINASLVKTVPPLSKYFSETRTSTMIVLEFHELVFECFKSSRYRFFFLSFTSVNTSEAKRQHIFSSLCSLDS